MERFFGGHPLAVILRLAIISLVVGVVLSAFGIHPRNLLYHLDLLVHRLYQLGFGAFEWVFQYLLLGAMVVVPIWLIARLLGLGRSSGDDTRR